MLEEVMLDNDPTNINSTKQQIKIKNGEFDIEISML